MKFSNFGSIVKTYKKNFFIRKGKFIAERKAIQAKKKKDREDRIEAVKSVQPFFKIKGSKSKKLNFLGDIKKFLGLMLAGFILQNLETILPILQNIIKKIGDIIKGTKEFLEGVIGGVQNFLDGLDDTRKKFKDLLDPVLNADLSKFVPFQNQLDKVLTGVLKIATIITGLYKGSELGKNPTKPIAMTARGAGGASVKRALALKRLQNLRSRNLPASTAGLQRLSEAVASVGDELSIKKRFVSPRAAVVAGELSSPGSGIPSGSKITPTNQQLFLKQLKIMSGDTAESLTRDAIEESYRRKLAERGLKDAAFAKRFGMDVGKLSDQARLDQFLDDYLTKPDVKPKTISPLEKLIGDPPQNLMVREKFTRIMKNARGFISPSNFTKLAKFGKDVGIGVLIEFAAGWAIDRGLEAIGLDEKSLLEKRVLKFNKLPKEKQKSIIERLNSELEKELNYQKTFFAKVEKVIALGDMTINERKIKSLASFLTAVSVSGAGSVYDLVSAGPLPDYLKGDVDIELPTQAPAQPSTPKISMLPLPPTGTGSPALAAAQQYGAARPGGRRHAGQDFDITGNEKFYSRIGGVVIYAGDSGGAGGSGTGYGNVVDIYNKELDVTERIAEARTILPGVVKGAKIKPGQAVVQGEDLTPSGSIRTGVIHYEIRKGKAGVSGLFEGTVDPLKFLEQLKANQNQASIKTSPSSLISNAGLNQSTTYSDAGMSVRREVNNIFIPINA